MSQEERVDLHHRLARALEPWLNDGWEVYLHPDHADVVVRNGAKGFCFRAASTVWKRERNKLFAQSRKWGALRRRRKRPVEETAREEEQPPTNGKRKKRRRRKKKPAMPKLPDNPASIGARVRYRKEYRAALAAARRR